jgi:hypothetical protein
MRPPPPPARLAPRLGLARSCGTLPFLGLGPGSPSVLLSLLLGRRRENAACSYYPHDRAEVRIQQTNELRKDTAALLTVLGLPPPPKLHAIGPLPVDDGPDPADPDDPSA